MEKIRLQREGAVATLTLNRPEAFNSLDLETVQGIERALREVEEDRRLRVLVVRGEGKSFCTGADLKYFRSIQEDRSAVRDFVLQINRAFDGLESLRVPVIAAVHGHCLAGGFELLQACDLALASTDAAIGDQHANFGLIPGAGGTQRLPRLIGPQRAKELLFTGRWLTGVEAAACGLVLRAVPRADLGGEVGRLASSIASKSAGGLACMKRLVQRGMQVDLEKAVAMEVEVFLGYFFSADVREGLRAFQEKRKPRFD